MHSYILTPRCFAIAVAISLLTLDAISAPNAFPGDFFNEAIIASAWVYSGNTPLAPGTIESPTGGIDLVARTTSSNGEPVPEPATMALVVLGLGAISFRRR